ncbi:hypothetical protein CRYUN_Cryun06bG0049900 [Craigia yunnanensis]
MITIKWNHLLAVGRGESNLRFHPRDEFIGSVRNSAFGEKQFYRANPQSLGKLGNLRQIFLQNNNLDGSIPEALQAKKGINLQVSPGNHLSA